jgi:hypothetical protein
LIRRRSWHFNYDTIPIVFRVENWISTACHLLESNFRVKIIVFRTLWNRNMNLAYIVDWVISLYCRVKWSRSWNNSIYLFASNPTLSFKTSFSMLSYFLQVFCVSVAVLLLVCFNSTSSTTLINSSLEVFVYRLIICCSIRE